MRNQVRHETDLLIVGAGFAGAATAYHLSRHFEGTILAVEKEERPGLHASGRNASLLFQPLAPPPIRDLLVRSRIAYEGIGKQIGFRQEGSLLLDREDELTGLTQDSRLGSRLISPEIVKQRIPLLVGHDFEAALWTGTDGVVDIRKLLDFYLEGAHSRGVRLQPNCEILELESDSPFRFRSTLGTIQTKTVVNAAGAWAGPFAQMCSATRVPLTPMKRHLFVLDGTTIEMREGPFVWNNSANFYFRPEAGGLLFCICDEEPSTSLVPTVSSEIREQLAEVLWKQLPELRDASQREAWACFRTPTSDGLFALGWDSQVEDFFWVAGLGGSGMACSWAVAEEAARLILAGPAEQIAALDPARFA